MTFFGRFELVFAAILPAAAAVDDVDVAVAVAVATAEKFVARRLSRYPVVDPGAWFRVCNIHQGEHGPCLKFAAHSDAGDPWEDTPHAIVGVVALFARGGFDKHVAYRCKLMTPAVIVDVRFELVHAVKIVVDDGLAVVVLHIRAQDGLDTPVAVVSAVEGVVVPEECFVGNYTLFVAGSFAKVVIAGIAEVYRDDVCFVVGKVRLPASARAACREMDVLVERFHTECHAAVADGSAVVVTATADLVGMAGQSCAFEFCEISCLLCSG